jgi:nucleoside-diphosphate-sugar epimerase
MKILIVGGNSSLAQVLKPILTQFAEVLTAGRTNCDIRLDLSDPALEIFLPDGVDVVINTAAHFGGRDADALRMSESVNVLGVLRLCQACTRLQVKQLVLVSSIFSMLDINSIFFSGYSLSKRHSEEVAQLYSKTLGLPVTIVRPSQFYGTGAAARKHQPFFTSMIDKAACGEDINLFGSRDALRNFIHVQDVAQVISLMIQRGVLGTYDCQYPDDVHYSEIAAAAIRAFNSRSRINFIKEQPDVPDNVFPIDDSLFRLINYYPQISIEEGMEQEAAARKLAR